MAEQIIDAPLSPGGQIDLFDPDHNVFMVRRCLETERPRLAGALENLFRAHHAYITTEGEWRIELCIEADAPIKFDPRDGGELIGDLAWLDEEVDGLVRGLLDKPDVKAVHDLWVRDDAVGRIARALLLLHNAVWLPEATDG